MKKVVSTYALAALCACTRQHKTKISAKPAAQLQVQPRRQANVREDFFDTQGRLKPSSNVVAGLVLPLGLKPKYHIERSHGFSSLVPLETLRIYFGNVLLGTRVDYSAFGFSFRDAVPKSSKGGVVHVDVIAMTSKGEKFGTLEVHELPPPNKALTPERVKELMQQIQRSAD